MMKDECKTVHELVTNERMPASFEYSGVLFVDGLPGDKE
jgi:hypothetical protein